MKIKYGLISCDSHAQLHKDSWTSRMSKAKFGEKIPELRIALVAHRLLERDRLLRAAPDPLDLDGW